MKKYLLNTIATVVFTLTLLAMILLRAACPVLVMPGFGVPNLVLISLVALLLDHYLVRNAPRCYICIPVFSFLTFGILPYLAGFAEQSEILSLGLTGCVVFTVTVWLFTSMTDRLSSGPAAKAAPFLSALGLYLASQVFMGMF